MRCALVPLMSVFALAACGSANVGDDEGGGGTTPGGQASCVTITVGEVREGEPTPGSIAAAFSVYSCDGVGVAGLTSGDFTVTEDGEAISATESQASVLEREAEAFVTLVLDNSPSVTSAGALDDAVDAAIGFVDRLFADGSSTTHVRVAFFSESFEEKLDYSNDKWAVLAAVESLRDDNSGANTTNLYGAIMDALDGSAAAQSARRAAMHGGVLLLGQVVVFTDGSDQAAIHTLDEALAALQSSSDDVVTLALGGEVDEAVLSQLGRDGSYLSVNASGLAEIFGEAADKLVSRKAAQYVLAYCTPKRAGTHQLVLRLGDQASSASISFSADAFAGAGANCSVSAIAGACSDKSCGGLWCGGCAGQASCTSTGQCGCGDSNYIGPDCDQCADPRFTGAACDSCADDHYAGPSCVSCLPRFTGSECESCTNPHFVQPGCTNCADGDTDASCNQCPDPKYTGANCNECSDPKFSGPECDQCADGFLGDECNECADPRATSPDCDAARPSISIGWPPPHAFLTANGTPIQISGSVADDDLDELALSVDGTVVPVQVDGSFSATLSPTWGANVARLVALNAAGQQTTADVRFIYSGAYAAAGSPAPAALIFGQERFDDGEHDPEDIDDLATAAKALGLLGETTASCSQVSLVFSAPVTVIPFDLGILKVMTGGTMEASLSGGQPIWTWGTHDVSLSARSGGLDLVESWGAADQEGLSLELPIVFSFDFDLEVEVFGNVLDTMPATSSAATTAHVTVDHVAVATGFTVHKASGQTAVVAQGAPEVEVLGVGLQSSLDTIVDAVLTDLPFGIPDQSFSFPLSQLIDLHALEDAVSAAVVGETIACVKSASEAAGFREHLEEWLLGSEDALELPLPSAGGQLVPLQNSPSAVVDALVLGDLGAKLDLDIHSASDPGDKDGAALRGDCLGGDPPVESWPSDATAYLLLSTDALNQALHSAWAHGGLDGDVEAGADDPYPGVTTTATWRLPPLWNDCGGPGAMSLQVGAVGVAVGGEHNGTPLDIEVVFAGEWTIEWTLADGISSADIATGMVNLSSVPAAWSEELEAALTARVQAALQALLNGWLAGLVSAAEVTASRGFASPAATENDLIAPMNGASIMAIPGWIHLGLD